ncbi:MAG TPA: type II secretion system protein GspM [Bryobacteraceae bacterium]|nr:type II secretion system protein GspM [Bryobacteraceae bacterium]
MTLQDRDKRALRTLALAAAIFLPVWLMTRAPSATSTVSAAGDTVDRSEKRLTTLRNALATVDGKEAVLKQAEAELADREKGLLTGDTSNQAQAHLLEIVNRVAKQQTPPIEIRQADFGQPRQYGDAYGIVSVAVAFDCRTDELLNLLAGLSQQPELIATEDVRTGNALPKNKLMNVRVTIAGIVPRRLVPEKKGLATF